MILRNPLYDDILAGLILAVVVAVLLVMTAEALPK